MSSNTTLAKDKINMEDNVIKFPTKIWELTSFKHEDGNCVSVEMFYREKSVADMMVYDNDGDLEIDVLWISDTVDDDAVVEAFQELYTKQVLDKEITNECTK